MRRSRCTRHSLTGLRDSPADSRRTKLPRKPLRKKRGEEAGEKGGKFASAGATSNLIARNICMECRASERRARRVPRLGSSVRLHAVQRFASLTLGRSEDKARYKLRWSNLKIVVDVGMHRVLPEFREEKKKKTGNISINSRKVG